VGVEFARTSAGTTGTTLLVFRRSSCLMLRTTPFLKIKVQDQGLGSCDQRADRSSRPVLTFRQKLEDVDVLVRRDEVGGELEHEGQLLEDPAAHDPSDDGDVPDAINVEIGKSASRSRELAHTMSELDE